MLRWTAVFAVILSAYGNVSCGGSQGPEAQNAGDVVAREIKPLRRKACEGDRETLEDASFDGYANLRHVYDGQREVCAEIDVNMDGRVDVTRLFGDDGKLSLEQYDLDFDGRLDQQLFYENGKLTRKELDTNFDRMIDTWVWCEGAFMTRLERDRHHTGHVDTWEDYERGLLAKAQYDDNNDGKVERWETYRSGRLAEIQTDGDRDGKPELKETVAVSLASAPPDPISCDGTPVPATAQPAKPAAPAAPPPPANDEGDSGDEEEGSGDSPSEADDSGDGGETAAKGDDK